MKFLISLAFVAVVTAQLQYAPNVNVQQPYQTIGQQYDSIDPSMQQVNPQWQQLVAQQKWNQIQPTVEQQYLNTINPILSNVGQFGQQYTPEQQQLLGQQTIPSISQMKFGLTGTEQQQFPIEQFGQADVNVPLVQQLSAMGIDINTLTPSQLARVQNLINAQKLQSMKFGLGATEQQFPIEQDSIEQELLSGTDRFNKLSLEQQVRSMMQFPVLSAPLQHKLQFQRMISLPTDRLTGSKMTLSELEEVDVADQLQPFPEQEALMTPSYLRRIRSPFQPKLMTGQQIRRVGLSNINVPIGTGYGTVPTMMTPQFGWGRRGGYRRGGYDRGGYRRGGYDRGGYRRGGFRRGGFRRGGYRPYLPVDPYDEEPYVVIDPYASGQYGRWDDPYFYGTTGQVQSMLQRPVQVPAVRQYQNVQLPTQQ